MKVTQPFNHILKREKIMSTQILTATAVLTQTEIERLQLHEFRCPPVKEFITDASYIIDNDFLTGDMIKDFVDVDSTSYVKHGDFVYSFVKMRNLDRWKSVLERFNTIESQLEQPTGLIESDLANLTFTFVYPAEIIDKIIQVNLDLYVESVKRVQYL